MPEPVRRSIVTREEAERFLAAFAGTMSELERVLDRETAELAAGRIRSGLAEEARKGALAAGKDADIVVLEPGRFVHDPSRSFSAVRWSSFEGREFSVRVAATYVRGQLAYDGEQIVNQPGDGMFLRPAAV